MRGRAWSCMAVRGRARSVVHGRAWSVVRGRACVVGHSWSFVVVRGRAWSVVRGRACVVGHSWSFVVVRGRARSVVRGRARSVVRGRAWSCRSARFAASSRQHGSQHCRAARFAASTAVTRTNERRKERTTSNNPLNPPGVGWVKIFYPIKVRVSMGTCVPNLGAIRRPVRKFGLSNL